MIPDIASSLKSEKEKQDTISLEKIRVLNNLLSTSFPADGQAGYGEYTKYEAAFDHQDRDVIKGKIMQLVKSL